MLKKVRASNTIKKLKLSALAVAAVFAAVFTFSSVVAAFTGNGAGTVGNPYQITTCEELQEMSDELDAHYILMNDIDCSDTVNWNGGEGFVPVGTSTAPFTGTLDGQGFEISDLFINRVMDRVGLFGEVSNPVLIENIGLTNVDISGNERTGALVGSINGTTVIRDAYVNGGSVNGTGWTGGLLGRVSSLMTVSDVYANVSVTGTDRVGGLVGSMGITGSTLTRAHATGNVSGTIRVGGLIGQASQSSISLSYATGNAIATGSSVGGLIGDIAAQTITNSYATGDVSGTSSIGGLIGSATFIASTATNVYATGGVTGSGSNVGGLVGLGSQLTFTNSFWDTETTGQSTSAGSGTMTGTTTEEMKTLATFSDATWDIELSETDLNDGYPFLSWQAGDSTPVWYIYQAPAGSGSNTTTFTNPLTDKQVTLEVDLSCDIQAASMTAESSNTVLDPGFDYPEGLINFTLDCSTPGYTTTVTQYYYGLTNDNFVLRKHNPNTNAYFTIAGYTLEQATHNGQAALKVTYQATDGGELDTDGAANGTIVDPVGLAQGVVGAPNTGLGGRLYN